MASVAPQARHREVRSPYDWVRDGWLRDGYFRLLLLLAPIQSILITPVQGTTPAFVLTLLAGVALVGTDRRYMEVVAFYGIFVMLYGVYMALSLSGFLLDQPDLTQLTVIREVYLYGFLKQSHLTQGLYLMVAMLFLYVNYRYYQESFLKYAFYGILLLAGYGFYEFVYYWYFQGNGDFLSNRNFGELGQVGVDTSERDFATGSLLQQSNIFGPDFMRLKSLVGEPSMYALTVTPFAVYAFARKWWLVFGILLLSLIFSTSSTALIGLAVGVGYAQIREREDFILYIAAFLVTVFLFYWTAAPFQEAADRLLFDKLDSSSGIERFTSFISHASVVLDGNWVRALFGLGFGTVRSTDMASNLLANVGILGFCLYSALILAPCFLMRRVPDRDAVIGALLAIYFMEMLTVSEYAYLPPWFMVALGYVRVRQQPALPEPGTLAQA